MDELDQRVLDQLRAVRDSTDCYLYDLPAVRAAAEDRGFDALVAFLDRGDDSAYHDALVALQSS